MEYISAKEAADLWGIDPSRIGKFARDGRIEGAKIVGRNWLIPANAEKPADGRTKAAKKTQKENVFRFPLFANFQENSFVPPLSSEESTLRKAQIDFYACRFKQAQADFEFLAESAENIYVRICAQFFLCVLSVAYDTKIDLKRYYGSMLLLLAKDFPYKKEMELFLPLFDFNIGKYALITEKMNSRYAYDFHSSATYMNAFLSVFKLPKTSLEENGLQCLEPYLTMCRFMERDGYYIEAQKLHFILFIAHFSVNHREAMRYHIRRAVSIAFEHDLIYALADFHGYYADEIEAVLSEYPAEFAERVRKSSKLIAEVFAGYAEKNDLTRIYSRLSKNDYRYIAYAVENFANKQVADICRVSERTVANRYNEIYNKLGVNSKRELVQEAHFALGSKLK